MAAAPMPPASNNLSGMEGDRQTVHIQGRRNLQKMSFTTGAGNFEFPEERPPLVAEISNISEAEWSQLIAPFREGVKIPKSYNYVMFFGFGLSLIGMIVLFATLGSGFNPAGLIIFGIGFALVFISNCMRIGHARGNSRLKTIAEEQNLAVMSRGMMWEVAEMMIMGFRGAPTLSFTWTLTEEEKQRRAALLADPARVAELQMNTMMQQVDKSLQPMMRSQMQMGAMGAHAQRAQMQALAAQGGNPQMMQAQMMAMNPQMAQMGMMNPQAAAMMGGVNPAMMGGVNPAMMGAGAGVPMGGAGAAPGMGMGAVPQMTPQQIAAMQQQMAAMQAQMTPQQLAAMQQMQQQQMQQPIGAPPVYDESAGVAKK